MTGIGEPSDRDWDPEAGAGPGSPPGGGTDDPEAASEDGLGPDGAHGGEPAAGESDEVVDAAILDAAESDEVVDAEILDAADVSAAVDEAFADDDPLALALNQRDEYLDSLRRLQAEFENYKKRVAKQQSDQVARAAQSLVEKLLPVLDTLDLATSHISDFESADGRALMAASGQLRDVLIKEGLERIDPLGEEFDPNTHEAVGHLPDEEEPGPGTDGSGDGAADGDAAGAAAGASGEPVVAEVMRPGYRWRGTVVRPAMVMVRG
jgi:molecular chaperone GrpE